MTNTFNLFYNHFQFVSNFANCWDQYHRKSPYKITNRSKYTFFIHFIGSKIMKKREKWAAIHFIKWVTRRRKKNFCPTNERMLMDQQWFYRTLVRFSCNIIPKCLCAVIVLCPVWFFFLSCCSKLLLMLLHVIFKSFFVQTCMCLCVCVWHGQSSK